MTHSKYRIRDIQSGLRYLVLFQIASFVSEFVVLFVFPEPPEVTAAVEVMAEIVDNEPSVVADFLGFTVVVVVLVLMLWSWWQLYRLDQRGVAKYLWATGLGFLIYAIPGVGGGWVTAPQGLVDSLGGMSSGAIICICILCPEIFKTPQTDDGTGPPDADPESGEQ
jgi:hypothetical protein